MNERMCLVAWGGVGLFAFLGACAGAPAAPFDTLKTAPVTAYRLQNWEPPAAAAVPAAGAATTLIPGLPPEIDKLIKAGAAALPPGLLPPGLIPGMAPATPTTQVDTTQRFHGFRIIGAPANVVDDKTRQEIVDIFGFEKNFGSTRSNCVYAEFGFSFARVNMPPADVLVSVSCDQVQSQNFIWPHKYTGLTNDSRARLVQVMKLVFGISG